MQLIRKIRSMHNPGLTYRLLITMFDRRNRIHRVLYQQLQDNFSMGLLQTIIETDTRLRESPGLGKTIFQHSPRTRATLQYRALSQEILDYMDDRKN